MENNYALTLSKSQYTVEVARKERKKERKKDRKNERERVRDRQADRQTDRQTDRIISNDVFMIDRGNRV